jgi:anti-sigma factor RsiW
MSAGDHPLEDLAPYALGMLDTDRRDEIDAHVDSCSSCASELGVREGTVAAMVVAEFPSPVLSADALRRLARRRHAERPISRITSIRALVAAAVLALVVGALGALDLQQRHALHDDDVFLAAMVTSHFAHAPLQAIGGAHVDAKVVYDRHGRWYEVIARGIDTSFRVAVTTRDGVAARERPERFVSRGQTSVLAIETPEAFAALELRSRDGSVIARAALPVRSGLLNFREGGTKL